MRRLPIAERLLEPEKAELLKVLREGGCADLADKLRNHFYVEDCAMAELDALRESTRGDAGYWNYRVVQYVAGGFGLHEVHYSSAREIEGWTEQPVGFRCDAEEGPQHIAQALMMAALDAMGSPILYEGDLLG